MVGLVALVMIGAVIAVVISARNRRTRLVPVWASAAAELGLAPPAVGGLTTKLAISGTVGRWHLRIRERSDDDSTWIAYELTGLQGIPSGLAIKAEHVGARLPLVGKLFSDGQEQIDTGDAVFDEAFIVTGHHRSAVEAFLTDERRRDLLTLARACPKFRIRDGELTYRFDGGTTKIGDVARPARAMLAAAESLESAPRTGGEVFPAPDAPHPPAARVAAPPPPESSPPESSPRESSPREPSPAAEPPATASEPSDPDASVVFPVPGRPAGSGATDVAPAHADQPDDAAQASVLAAVFGVAAGEGTTVFGERLHGRRIRWSGTVERVGRYANDLDLGAGPGIRAVVDLGPVDTVGYGTARIAAIVGLPVDAPVAAGTSLRFDGTVASLDHFARRLVVTDATAITD